MSWLNPLPPDLPIRLPRQRPRCIVPSFIGENGQVLNLLVHHGAGSVVRDYSGYRNHGNIIGATWRDGAYGWALDLNGTSNYISVPSTPSLRPTRISLELWLTVNAMPTPICVVDPDQDSFLTGICFAIRYNLAGYYITLGNVVADGYTAFVITAGIFYHFVFTYDGVNVGTYINGSLQSTFPIVAAPNINWSTNPIHIGARGIPPWLYLRGLIALVRIYNRALSPPEIQNHYQTTRGLFGV